jgi:hypothetical protein
MGALWAAEQLLDQARALKAAFPGGVAGVPVADLPDGGGYPDLMSALRHLRDEMLLVRAGKVTDLTVLDDEIACVERLLPRCDPGDERPYAQSGGLPGPSRGAGLLLHLLPPGHPDDPLDDVEVHRVPRCRR